MGGDDATVSTLPTLVAKGGGNVGLGALDFVALGNNIGQVLAALGAFYDGISSLSHAELDSNVDAVIYKEFKDGAIATFETLQLFAGSQQKLSASALLAFFIDGKSTKMRRWFDMIKIILAHKRAQSELNPASSSGIALVPAITYLIETAPSDMTEASARMHVRSIMNYLLAS